MKISQQIPNSPNYGPYTSHSSSRSAFYNLVILYKPNGFLLYIQVTLSLQIWTGVHKFRCCSPRCLKSVQWQLILSAHFRQLFPSHAKICNSSLTCTKQKAPDIADIHRSLLLCGSSVRNLLHITILAPWIWGRCLHFLKICGPLCNSTSWVWGLRWLPWDLVQG